MEIYTDYFTDEDEVDALLLRLQVMFAKASHRCTVISFSSRPAPAVVMIGQKAQVIDFADAVQKREDEMMKVVDSYIPDEIKIDMLIDQEEKKLSDRAHKRKCDEIERLLDLLSAPTGDNIISRAAHMDVLNDTCDEAKEFHQKYREKCMKEIEAENEADEKRFAAMPLPPGFIAPDDEGEKS